MHCYGSGILTDCDDCVDCRWKYVGDWLRASLQEFQWECFVLSRRTWRVFIVSWTWISIIIWNNTKVIYYFRGPASKIIVKFCLAVSCGVLGAIFTFPGLRMARMHWDSLKYCRESKVLQMLLNVSFVLPFIIVILWIKPISREILTNRIFTGMEHPLYVISINISQFQQN